jgi:methionine--tRNA ligase beta chain
MDTNPPKPINDDKEEDGGKKLAPGTLEDFAQLDIRVGKILEVWNHPESDGMYCEKIDIGSEVREIGTGVRKCIPIDKVEGLVLVMANLRPKKCGGFVSNGMVMCAGNAEETVFEFMRPPADSKVGERITLEDYDKISQDVCKQLNSKKKYLEKCFPIMKTDKDCYATILGKRWKTSAGFIKSATLAESSIS